MNEEVLKHSPQFEEILRMLDLPMGGVYQWIEAGEAENIHLTTARAVQRYVNEKERHFRELYLDTLLPNGTIRRVTDTGLEVYKIVRES